MKKLIWRIRSWWYRVRHPFVNISADDDDYYDDLF